MRRALVFGVVLLVCSPSLSQASHIVTLFPDNNGMAISTSGELNGITHFLMQANLADLNLHAVFMTASGNPDFANVQGGRPWVFGQLVSVVKSGPISAPTFTLTWNVSTSTGGSAPFVLIGSLTIVVTP
jgi:hypothetical protein